LPGVESSGSSETVEMVGEEHEGRGLTIVGGGIPREMEAARVVSDGGDELINLAVFCDREHDWDGSGKRGQAAAQCLRN
jgi:heptaprenylglyceryl phosphate synthase